MNSPVIEVEALTRRFGAITAVDSPSLTANDGKARVGGFSITTQPVDVRRANRTFSQFIVVYGLLLVIARIVRTRERFMGVGQVLTLPLFSPVTQFIQPPRCPL